MVALPQLTLTADGDLLRAEHDGGTGAPFFPHCNDAPDGVSTDWVANDTSSATGEAWFALTDVPADFGSMDTLDIDIDAQAVGSPANDTLDLRCQIFAANGDTGNPLTSNRINTFDETDTTRAQRNFTFSSLTGSKADWDGAFIRFFWNYNKVTSPDGLTIRIFGMDIDGTYTETTGPAIPVVMASYRQRRN